MRILIAGGYGTFCKYLIARLKRENHEVYIISGKNYEKANELSAFRVVNYNFNLNDEKLKFIIDSVLPDIIVFLGAFDKNYDFKDNQIASSEYTAGLSNLLDVISAINIKRFVYLSTASVYGEAKSIPITENCKKNPLSVRNIIISEGEALCTAFAKLSDMKFTILRFSDIYGILSDKNPDLFQTLFEEAEVSIKTFEPYVNKNFNPIYITDAIDAVYKTITDDKNNGTYNVSGTQTELTYIYKKIKELTNVSVLVTDDIEDINDHSSTEPKNYQIINNTVDCSLFKKHYGYRPIVDIDTGLERMYKDLRKHYEKKKKPFSKKIEKFKFFKELMPLLENLLMFIILISASIWQQSVPGLLNVDFTVLYIIIIAMTFGLFQGSIAAFLSVLLLILQNSRQGISAFDIFINLDIMIRILEIFIIAAICGYSKDRCQAFISEKNAELWDSKNELETIYQINDANISIKQELNERLTNYDDSLAKLYSVVDKLNELQPDAIFFSAVNVVMEIMSTKDVSIYIVTGDDFKMCRLAAKTPSSDRVLKKSLPLTDLGELVEYIERDKVFVNRNLLENLPMMAAPIYVSNKLASIIMIWTVEFDNLTLYSENRFLVLSRLISSVIGRAYIYMQNMQNSMYLQGTRILTEEAFMNTLNIHKEAAKSNTASYYTMLISNNDMNIEELSEKAGKLIRVNDYIGQCADTDKSVYILLTNTNSSDARFVYNRLLEAGFNIKELIL